MTDPVVLPEMPDIPADVRELLGAPPVRSVAELKAYFGLLRAIAKQYSPRDINEWLLAADQTVSILRTNTLRQHEVNLLKLSEEVVQDERAGTKRRELLVAQLQADRAAGLPDQVPKVPEVPRTREPMDDTRGLVRCLPALEQIGRLSDGYRAQRMSVPRELLDYRKIIASLKAGDIRVDKPMIADKEKAVPDDEQIVDEEEVADTPSLVPSGRKP